ncbi:glucose 1-dehydrogenase [Solibacillus cecembensis]|uniref:glucose 1-dehydrogenase n=1 Tax=Solibacillus cecembensis TaxID=459347 RepID=UPI00071720D8
MMLMEGKAGLVTAAGSGIGRASALALAKAGAKVMVSDVNVDGGLETVKLIQEIGGEAHFFKCDASNEEEVIALVDETVNKFGKLDFAHNNAGINAQQTKIGEADSAAWDKTIKVNLYGTFYSIKHQVNAMLKTGGGSIVNTASGAGMEGAVKMAAYVSSKHAVVGLTKAAALEYGKDKIRVNAIAPGSTMTPAIEGWAKTAPEQFNAVLKAMPSGEMTQAEDQGNAVLFLCSDLAKQVSGVVLPIDGGYTAGKLPLQ